MKPILAPKHFFYFTNGSIGDFMMAIYFAENVHLNGQQTDFWIITSRNKKLLAELLGGYSYIKTLELNRVSFLKNLSFFVKNIFSRNFVLLPSTFGIIPLQTKLVAKALTLFNKSMLVGFQDKGKTANEILYDKILEFDPAIHYYMNLVRALSAFGFQQKKMLPEFKYVKSDIGVAEKNGLSVGKYVVLQPFASSPKRTLPLKRWSTLVEFFLQSCNNAGMKFVLAGAPSDMSAGNEIMNLVSADKENFVNLIGKANMREMAELVDGCKLFVGVDSGMGHVAGCLQKKSLIIGNLSNPCWLPTYNNNAVILYNGSACPCAPCNKRKCLEECKTGYSRCMIDIPDEEIKKKFTENL